MLARAVKATKPLLGLRRFWVAGNGGHGENGAPWIQVMRNRRRPTILRLAAAFSFAIACAASFAPMGHAQIAPPSPAPSPAAPPAATPALPGTAVPPAADTPSGGQPAAMPPGAATPPAAAPSSGPPIPSQRMVRIGTNAVAGLYFPAGGAICRMMMRARIDGSGLRCLVDSTNGSTANVRGLRNGDL
jgi:hypothetical protein